jgi:hypothetical protein
VVQLGVLLNAVDCPALIGSTQVGPQLRALHDCGWINASAFETLDNAYAELSQARLRTALVDDDEGSDATALPAIAQALCDEILG